MPDTEEIHQLIAECLKGNTASQKKLFDTYSGKMFAVCLRYAHDHDTAKDYLQEGFIKVFQHLNSFRFQGSFEGWIRKIMVRTVIENFHVHSKKFNHTLSEELPDMPVSPTATDNLQLQDLLHEIQQLPLGYRTVFNLYVIDGYSHKEIAEQLGITENTSKTQLRKARLFLMNVLNKT
jgi:RNA polymerase sigma-70 factor (ECF subfamily)